VKRLVVLVVIALIGLGASAGSAWATHRQPASSVDTL